MNFYNILKFVYHYLYLFVNMLLIQFGCFNLDSFSFKDFILGPAMRLLSPLVKGCLFNHRWLQAGLTYA